MGGSDKGAWDFSLGGSTWKGTWFRIFLIVASICIVLTSMNWLNITYIAECPNICPFLPGNGNETEPKPFKDLNRWTKAIYITYWVLITIFFLCFAWMKSEDCSRSKVDMLYLFICWVGVLCFGMASLLFGVGRAPTALVYIGLLGVILISFKGFDCFDGSSRLPGGI